MIFKQYNFTEGKYDLQGDGRLVSDISYKNDSKRNKLDLYLPSIKKDKYPIVIFIHGGGFIKSDKTHHLSEILNVLQDGYAVVSLNYRLNDEVVYPENLEDCVDAINFLSQHSLDWHIDTQRIVLWGETHGGLLASQIGIQRHLSAFYRIVGVVSFYAPINLYEFHRVQINTGQLMKIGDQSADQLSFGEDNEDKLLKLLQSYDPLSDIDGTQPPFYLLHGEKDSFVPPAFSQRFADTLTRNGVPIILNFVPNGTHGIDFYDHEVYNIPIRKFINNCFIRS
ncbi:MAG: alpha/beta hydrolase [Oenococcus sp.]|uniref:alpha/beta hydrolase n=1 Tax=Oenococcus TaxID=46254 RepID=UPI0021E93BF0|nr:alpha/beta hydrolase [Oenococcus kitaharae]MCV3296386.1 alpha/beta hydrolase [Oenococcus kitaharae]